MSASPTAVFQLITVKVSCGSLLSLDAAGSTGGPTLLRQRLSEMLSLVTIGANQATAWLASLGDSSAVERAPREVPETHACEAPATNNRKKREYERQPDRPARRDFIEKMFRWE
jgi:hypothetical protein